MRAYAARRGARVGAVEVDDDDLAGLARARAPAGSSRADRGGTAAVVEAAHRFARALEGARQRRRGQAPPRSQVSASRASASNQVATAPFQTRPPPHCGRHPRKPGGAPARPRCAVLPSRRSRAAGDRARRGRRPAAGRAGRRVARRAIPATRPQRRTRAVRARPVAPWAEARAARTPARVEQALAAQRVGDLAVRQPASVALAQRDETRRRGDRHVIPRWARRNKRDRRQAEDDVGHPQREPCGQSPRLSRRTGRS